MKDSDIDAWKAYCQRASTSAADGDAAVLESDWAGAGITPPPARGAPIARLPLERALSLVEKAEGAARGEVADSLLREALDWLDNPHPRTPPEMVSAIRRQRARIRSILDD